MGTISLQRKQMLMDCITAVDDEKFFAKIEKGAGENSAVYVEELVLL